MSFVPIALHHCSPAWPLSLLWGWQGLAAAWQPHRAQMDTWVTEGMTSPLLTALFVAWHSAVQLMGCSHEQQQRRQRGSWCTECPMCGWRMDTAHCDTGHHALPGLAGDSLT